MRVVRLNLRPSSRLFARKLTRPHPPRCYVTLEWPPCCAITIQCTDSPFTARYSFIQLNVLGQCGDNKILQNRMYLYFRTLTVESTCAELVQQLYVLSQYYCLALVDCPSNHLWKLCDLFIGEKSRDYRDMMCGRRNNTISLHFIRSSIPMPPMWDNVIKLNHVNQHADSRPRGAMHER